MNYIRDHCRTKDNPIPENRTINSLNNKQIALTREIMDAFVKKEGRRPRILITGMELKDNDRTRERIASFISELGFDVDVSLIKQTPHEIARMAVENDVHLICISSSGNVDPTLVLQLTDALKDERGEEIRIIVGGEIPLEDHNSLHHAGAAGVFNINRMVVDFAKWISQVEIGKEVCEDAQYYIKGVINQDRCIIARAISLIESSLTAHQEIAKSIIHALLPRTGNAIRIGISGVPGVGKSTFIESFAMKLIEQEGYRVAVLAVDPSSSRSGGSIMGDKTRMERLSMEPGVFIRPSPSRDALGGVAEKTKEATVVCEAAGFDVIIVETVGVGQSETRVASMVDFFLVMLLAGAGDEIQGIKKGVLELADAIAINKADGDNIERVRKAKEEYQSALCLLYPSSPVWSAPVLTCSALTMAGIDKIWETILDHREKLKAAGELDAKRKKQAVAWMWDLVERGLRDRFYKNPEIIKQLPKIIEDVKEGKKGSSAAAFELLYLNSIEFDKHLRLPNTP